jgi:serine/threonine protein kinase
VGNLRGPAAGEVVCGYNVVRVLGTRDLPAYLARDAKGAFVVVERLPLARAPAHESARFLRQARSVMRIHHANVVPIRDVQRIEDDVFIVSDDVDGATYADVTRAAEAKGEAVPLATHLRILIDVLQGLSKLHELRDATGVPLPIVHSEVSPHNVLVGLDGRARLSHVVRPSQPATSRSAEAIGYLAPEVLLDDPSADARADVFSLGVMLWEAIAARRMHDDLSTGAVVLRLIGEKVGPPRRAVEAWAAPLVDAAMRAIAADPSARFATAADLADVLRRAAGGRLASKEAVARVVESLLGPEIRSRRAPKIAGPPPLPRVAPKVTSRPPPPVGDSLSSLATSRAPPPPAPSAVDSASLAPVSEHSGAIAHGRGSRIVAVATLSLAIVGIGVAATRAVKPTSRSAASTAPAEAPRQGAHEEPPAEGKAPLVARPVATPAPAIKSIATADAQAPAPSEPKSEPKSETKPPGATAPPPSPKKSHYLPGGI